MPAIYQPKSQFLMYAIAEEAPLAGSEQGEANLRRLVETTRDDDRSNRDWAVFLLSQIDMDTSDVRHALLRAADDDDEMVRAEAALGLARRDRDVALPFVQKALSGDAVAVPILEAAALCADGSLVADLRRLAERPEGRYIDKSVGEALEACESGIPRDI